MTYPAASGWGNLPNGVWDPIIYAKDYLNFFRTISVVEEITNTDYTGEISQMGSSVKIMKEPVITTRTYERGTKIVPQDLNDEDLTMVVDKGIYTAFQIDDIEKRFAHNPWESTAISSAAYALKNAYDREVIGYMGDNGTTTSGTGTDTTPVTIGFDAGDDFVPTDYINRFARLLDENDVPEDGRFFVATPAFYEYLAKEDSKLVEVQVTGDPVSILRQRKLATSRPIHGFTMLKSNNLVNSTTNNRVRVLAGHISTTATAKAITESEKFRSQEFFGDVYRGLLVYGRKLLRPEGLFTGHLTLS